MLAPYVDAVRAVYDAVAGLPDPVPAHRVHGDLHLGQVLRTPHGLVDPRLRGRAVGAARTSGARRDSPMRDVAGMLRSFDYAAFSSCCHRPARVRGRPDRAVAAAWHAKEWAARNRDAFCDGYAAARGRRPARHGPLLRAFELDKAVYEVVYEARSRPRWVPIPLSSIKRLTDGATVVTSTADSSAGTRRPESPGTERTALGRRRADHARPGTSALHRPEPRAART